MIPLLIFALVVLLVLAYCMVDGRNVTIKHLKQDLSLRNQYVIDASKKLDLANDEKNKNADKLTSIRREYEAKLHEKNIRVEKIIGELSEVRWTRDMHNREQYCVTIMVNPQMFGGYNSRMGRDDLMYIARHIGDQVAYELASNKYIQKANEDERFHAEQARSRRPYTF